MKRPFHGFFKQIVLHAFLRYKGQSTDCGDQQFDAMAHFLVNLIWVCQRFTNGEY